ncbi:response regulator transcription factor [Methylorubrum extorquens]|uniref:DNA-binding response regulator in two-component regulatory system n=2 Tax=Methylorubrum extorquens TaxID=408 RepID=C5B5T4_METEA|nr:response regulator transcription factor [Methylorubrum extorquens]ACS43816.1 DNA-binding response regulator in two-component regulatory system [Methylorubrum extorquens AM1]EHP93969.1 two component transcriptional regulator, winged helix family [Methylorubrum extorquens DSM 13060]MCP1546344.1 two-component system OmpR family response regulator [Methylorubrum extorquens]MCP1591011.1 two-component system OmpR family response regulator [Methylorubrum extorquens]
MAKLLLIEDDAATAEEILGDLHGRGHEVAWAATGPDGAAAARSGGWNAIILDRMLPGLDGLTLLRDLRGVGDRTPALVLSALGDVDERIRGLRAGGDDYLGKPFVLAELAARIEALLRRPTDARETFLRVGTLELDLIAGTGRRGRRDLELLPRELKLLEYLMRRPGQVVTRAMMFEEVWNYRFAPKSNLIDVHVGRLRKKLEAEGEPMLIHNVRGEGFTLTPDV